MGRFIIHKDKAGGVSYFLKADDGEVLLLSDAYSSDNACRKGIASVTKNSFAANLEDFTVESGKKKIKHPKFEIYQEGADRLRFRLKATNGQVIGNSKVYKDKEECLRVIEAIRAQAHDAIVDEE